MEKVDAHIHLVNSKFIMKEIFDMEFYRVLEIYDPKEKPFSDLMYFPESSQNLLQNLFFKRLHSFTKKPRKQYESYQKIVQDIIGEPAITAVLMMDILFMLGESCETAETLEKYHEKQRKFMEEGEVEVPFLKNLTFSSKSDIGWVTLKNDKYYMSPMHLNVMRKSYIKKRKAFVAYNEVFREELYSGVFMSEGFRYQLEKIRKLKVRYPDKVFPFFAYDPRRLGALELAERLIVDSPENQRFHGIKLYPSMGYHPDLCDPLLDFCNEHKLPITMHAGLSGMGSSVANGDFENNFGNPALWDDILSRPNRRNLRINFAHFGNGQDQKQKDSPYFHAILNLLEKYDNVYTDISCYMDKEPLEDVYKTYRSNPRVRDRLMFGTDYPAFLVYEDPDTHWKLEAPIRKYYKRVQEVFGSDFKKIAEKVPLKFLFAE